MLIGGLNGTELNTFLVIVIATVSFILAGCKRLIPIVACVATNDHSHNRHIFHFSHLG